MLTGRKRQWSTSTSRKAQFPTGRPSTVDVSVLTVSSTQNSNRLENTEVLICSGGSVLFYLKSLASGLPYVPGLSLIMVWPPGDGRSFNRLVDDTWVILLSAWLITFVPFIFCKSLDYCLLWIQSRVHFIKVKCQFWHLKYQNRGVYNPPFWCFKHLLLAF